MNYSWLRDFDKTINDLQTALVRGKFEPTGIQDELIQAVGNNLEYGKTTIVVTYDPNKSGKTATGVNVLKNIITSADPEWFDYPAFRNWPFPKTGRIVGTAQNTADTGQIRREFHAWWPDAAANSVKSGKEYHSQYVLNGHDWDVMTYNQEPEEFEGALCGWVWCDEPIPAQLMGALASRFSYGGLWLITATGIGANIGAFVDSLADLVEKSVDKETGKERVKVITLVHTAEDDCAEHGIPNHKGTRRGLRGHEQILNWMATLPPDEVDARANGRINHKAGKVLKDFDRSVHVRPVDISDPVTGAQDWNIYVFQDPHRKYYPFTSFWGLTPDEQWVCYNEWPVYDDFHEYYHKIRDDLVCSYSFEQLGKIIKLYEGHTFGLRACKRGLDPFFAATTEAEFGRKTGSWVSEYAAPEIGLVWEVPTRTSMDAALVKVQAGLKWDRQIPLGPYNRPKIVIASHCLNMIRSFERHYWLDGKERQAEEYKDPIDTARGVLALAENARYRSEWSSREILGKNRNMKKTRVRRDMAMDPYRHLLHETACA